MITVLRDSDLEEIIGGAYGVFRGGCGVNLASIETRVLTSFFNILGIPQGTQLNLLRSAGLGSGSLDYGNYGVMK